MSVLRRWASDAPLLVTALGLSFACFACGSVSTRVAADGASPALSDAGTTAAGDGPFYPVTMNSDDASEASAFDPDSSQAIRSDADETLVSGFVVDVDTRRPLANRSVYAGAVRGMTDENGYFSLSGVGVRYDAIIVEPDGTRISVYRGVTLRTPVFAHNPSLTSAKAALSATVQGQVSGGGAYPLGSQDELGVYLFSDRFDSRSLLGGSLPSAFHGPGFQLGAFWNGPQDVTAQLLALAAFADATDGGRSFWVASQPLPLTNGQSAMVTLALSAAPLMRVSGQATTPQGAPLTQLQQYYRLSFPHSGVDLQNDINPHASFDYLAPDLTGVGATLCAAALSASSALLITERCGITPATGNLVLALQAAPSLTAPLGGAMVSSGGTFAWTAFVNGIHVLKLESSAPSQSAPSIWVFTAASSVSWPDLSVPGIAFPNHAAYQFAVQGLGPYASIDDAVGPAGVGARFRAETRNSTSASVGLTTSP